jgi:hypothetical protein
MFETIYVHGYQTKTGKPPTLRERLAMRKVCGPYMLQPRNPRHCDTIGFYQSSQGWLDMGDGPINLRLKKANDCLSYSRLTQISGYYIDRDGFETIEPIIALLPHGRGFLAGWTMGKGMSASIDRSTVWSDAAEAARAAHNMADYHAEECREFEERDRQEQNEEEED